MAPTVTATLATRRRLRRSGRAFPTLVTATGTTLEIVPVGFSEPKRPDAPPASQSTSSWCARSLRAALVVSGWAALVAFTLPSGSVPRAVITWGYLFSCPGLALVTLARLRDPLERLVYSVAASAAITALVSMFFVILRHGSARSTVLTLAVWTTLAPFIPVRPPARNEGS